MSHHQVECRAHLSDTRPDDVTFGDNMFHVLLDLQNQTNDMQYPDALEYNLHICAISLSFFSSLSLYLSWNLILSKVGANLS